jgi:hypothetical protein
VKLTAAQLQQKPSDLSQRICNSLFLGTGELNAAAPTTSAVPAKVTSFVVPNKHRRKRKPQKPGKTAKMNDRHFVQHNYHDHALDRDVSQQTGKRRRGGVAVAFPMKLHAMLDQIEQDGLGHVISWQPHGRCFVVHKPKEFVDTVLPQYFKQSKMTSFQRQLNLYGFQRLTRGNDATGYYHELFLRGKTFLCKQMTRTKVKGTGYKAASSPDSEPDFWSMPPVNPITPSHSEDDESLSDSTAHSTSPQDVPSNVLAFSPISSQPPIPKEFEALRTVQKTVSRDMMIEPLSLHSNISDSDSEVLDEVVDDLFLHAPAEENDDIMDFVKTWNPVDSFDTAEEIVDDLQLGVLLEKILAE